MIVITIYLRQSKIISMLKRILILFIGAAFFNSCSLPVKTSKCDFDYVKITKQGIIQKPLVADLNVSKEKKQLSKTYLNSTYDQAKNLLMADYTQEYKCDVIVHPIFCSNSTTKNEKTEITISVNGYPASYQNIRNFELKDTANFFPTNISIVNPNEADNKASSSQPAEIIKKGKGKGLIVGGIVLGVIILVAALL